MFIRLFQEFLFGAGAAVMFRHNVVVFIRGAVHLRSVFQPAGGPVHFLSLAEFVADVGKGFFILMQTGGQTGIRLAAGLADKTVFIHHQSFRTGVGGISRGIVWNQRHDDKGGFSRLAYLFFQFAVVGFRIRKISGLAKCRTLVYFAHHGRKVPGAVLNDKEGPLAHQALVHTGQ